MENTLLSFWVNIIRYCIYKAPLLSTVHGHGAWSIRLRSPKWKSSPESRLERQAHNLQRRSQAAYAAALMKLTQEPSHETGGNQWGEMKAVQLQALETNTHENN